MIQLPLTAAGAFNRRGRGGTGLHLCAADLDPVQPHELGSGTEHGLELANASQKLIAAPEQRALCYPPRVVRRLFL